MCVRARPGWCPGAAEPGAGKGQEVSRGLSQKGRPHRKGSGSRTGRGCPGTRVPGGSGVRGVGDTVPGPGWGWQGQLSQGLLTKWEVEDTALGLCRREQACVELADHTPP